MLRRIIHINAAGNNRTMIAASYLGISAVPYADQLGWGRCGRLVATAQHNHKKDGQTEDKYATNCHRRLPLQGPTGSRDPSKSGLVIRRTGLATVHRQVASSFSPGIAVPLDPSLLKDAC
jgi:hypothetical protein